MGEEIAVSSLLKNPLSAKSNSLIRKTDLLIIIRIFIDINNT